MSDSKKRYAACVRCMQEHDIKFMVKKADGGNLCRLCYDVVFFEILREQLLDNELDKQRSPR